MARRHFDVWNHSEKEIRMSKTISTIGYGWIGSMVLLVLLTGAYLSTPAQAALCKDCTDMIYITATGQCGACRAETASSAYAYCPKCAIAKGACDACGKVTSPPKVVPVVPAPTTIDTKKDATYTSGDWKYVYRVTSKGTRSEGRAGELFYKGQAVPDLAEGRENDHYNTPFGRLAWVGRPALPWWPKGWVPTSLSRFDRRGALLATPTATAVIQTTTQTIRLTESENGKILTVLVDQEIIVRLAGNATTGYRWTEVGTLPASLERLGKITYQPDPNTRRRVGVGGSFIAHYRITKPGVTTLQLQYHRPWETSQAPAKTFTVRLIAKAQAHQRPGHGRYGRRNTIRIRIQPGQTRGAATYHIGRSQVAATSDALRTILTSYAQSSRTDKTVLISAERTMRWGVVLGAYQAAKQAGFGKIEFADSEGSSTTRIPPVRRYVVPEKITLELIAGATRGVVTYRVNGQAVDTATALKLLLQSHMTQATQQIGEAKAKKIPVVIQSGQSVPWSAVVQAFNAASGAQFTNVGFAK
jgi:predicted secreted protein/biopolymer transport protein ExbD